MAFNIEQCLIDCRIKFKKVKAVYKSKQCVKFKLKHCLFNNSHNSNDACIFQYESGKIIYKCFHNSCKNFTWEDAKSKLQTKYSLSLKEYWQDSKIKAEYNSSQNQITYLSGTDIISQPVEIEWLIKNMLSMHESILIHSKGGLGKSMFVLYLILILASFDENSESFNSEFLDSCFTIPQERASLVIGAENGRITTYQRLKKMCGDSECFKDGLKNVFFLSQYGDTTITGEVFSDESFCKFLVGYIKQIEQEQNVKIDILVIDPLISFAGVKNENDAADMRPSLDAIDNVCRQAKCTPFVIHHDKKDGDNYRGSTAINDWTRNRISLKRESIAENRITDIDSKGKVGGTRIANIPCIRITHEKCNNFQIFESFLVRMTNKLHFERVEETISPEDAKKIKKVEQALTDMKGGAKSTNELAKVYEELAGVSKSTAKKHIAMAVDNKVIERKSTQKSGSQSYEYYLIKN